MKLLINLSLCLLIGSSSLAETSIDELDALDGIEDQQDLYLKEKNPAPHDGVLMWEDGYKYLRSRDDFATKLEGEFVKSCESPSGSPVTYILLGIVAGVLVSRAVK